MSGQGIDNLLGGAFGNHYATLTQYFELDEPCVSACADTCGENFACEELVDNLIDQINKRNLIGNVPLTPQPDGKSGFIKVSKITSCDSPSGYQTTNCEKWTLEVADNGTQADLGVVQAQYPSDTVERISRSGITSTYQIIVCDGSTPTDFDSTTLATIPNCENCTDCPSGYTETTEVPVFVITRDDAGTAATLATLKVDYAGITISSSAVITSHVPGVTTYTIYGNAGTTLAQMTARATAVAKGDAVIQSGTLQSVCTPPVTAIAWVDCNATCTKATQTWTVTVGDTVCGESRLTELQAYYENIGTVTSIGTGTCAHKFQIAILSDNVSCNDCADETYTWTPPVPFEGSVWKIVERGAGTGCVCGIKFEGAYIARERKECFFEEVAYEVEPLFFTVSTRNPDNTQFAQLCEADIPVTVIQNPRYQIGFGSSVVSEQLKLSKFYQLDQWRSNPATRDAYSYELGINLDSYYDELILTTTAPMPNATSIGGFGQTQANEMEYHIYYPAGNGTAFAGGINSYVSYPGSTVIPVIV